MRRSTGRAAHIAAEARCWMGRPWASCPAAARGALRRRPAASTLAISGSDDGRGAGRIAEMGRSCRFGLRRRLDPGMAAGMSDWRSAKRCGISCSLVWPTSLFVRPSSWGRSGIVSDHPSSLSIRKRAARAGRAAFILDPSSQGKFRDLPEYFHRAQRRGSASADAKRLHWRGHGNCFHSH